MCNIQKISAGLAILFIGVFLYQELFAPPASVILLVAGIFCLILAYLDPRILGTLDWSWLGMKFNFKRATASEVKEALATDQAAEQGNNLTEEEIKETRDKLDNKKAIEKTDADYLELATIAWKEKDYDAALQAVYVGLDRPQSEKTITAALYSRLGSIDHDLNLHGRSETHYLRAIEIDPEYATAHNNLGNHYLKTKDFKKAEVTFKKTLKIDPEYAGAYYNLGVTYHETDRTEEAEEFYKKALKIEPELVEAHYNLGVLYEIQNKLDEAELKYIKALEIDPEDHNFQNTLKRVQDLLKKEKE